MVQSQITFRVITNLNKRNFGTFGLLFNMLSWFQRIWKAWVNVRVELGYGKVRVMIW